VRYKLIEESLQGRNDISMEDLMKLLTTKYPAGLRCCFYDEFFGCLRSMIFDVTDGIVYICFGTPAENKWHSFRVSDEIGQESYPVFMERAAAPAGFYDMIAE
jgi:hypothetical protein